MEIQHLNNIFESQNIILTGINVIVMWRCLSHFATCINIFKRITGSTLFTRRSEGVVPHLTVRVDWQI